MKFAWIIHAYGAPREGQISYYFPPRGLQPVPLRMIAGIWRLGEWSAAVEELARTATTKTKKKKTNSIWRKFACVPSALHSILGTRCVKMLTCRDCGRVTVIAHGDSMNCISSWGKLIRGISVGICRNLTKSGNGGITWVSDDARGERARAHRSLRPADSIPTRPG